MLIEAMWDLCGWIMLTGVKVIGSKIKIEPDELD